MIRLRVQPHATCTPGGRGFRGAGHDPVEPARAGGHDLQVEVWRLRRAFKPLKSSGGGRCPRTCTSAGRWLPVPVNRLAPACLPTSGKHVASWQMHPQGAFSLCTERQCGCQTSNRPAHLRAVRQRRSRGVRWRAGREAVINGLLSSCGAPCMGIALQGQSSIMSSAQTPSKLTHTVQLARMQHRSGSPWSG